MTPDLDPARLVHFTDWVTTLPPRPLPRTAIPVPGEYHLDYTVRLAHANHLEFLELSNALDDPAAILHHPNRFKEHKQERLAAAADQPLARIARLYWDDPGEYLRDPEGFRQMLRPACRYCAARRGIAEPVACYLPPHLTVCRRHRIWIGPSARTHAGQLDVSPLPEILRAQRRHVALVHQHPWQQVDTAIDDATRAIHQALRASTWIPGQRRRLHQLAPGTWHQPLAAVLGARPPPGQTTVQASPSSRSRSTPDVVWLAARSLRTRNQASSGDLGP